MKQEIKFNNLVEYVGESITCEIFCNNPNKSETGCDGNCRLQEMTQREKDIVNLVTKIIREASLLDPHPVGGFDF